MFDSRSDSPGGIVERSLRVTGPAGTIPAALWGPAFSPAPCPSY